MTIEQFKAAKLKGGDNPFEFFENKHVTLEELTEKIIVTYSDFC